LTLNAPLTVEGFHLQVRDAHSALLFQKQMTIAAEASVVLDAEASCSDEARYAGEQALGLHALVSAEKLMLQWRARLTVASLESAEQQSASPGNSSVRVVAEEVVIEHEAVFSLAAVMHSPHALALNERDTSRLAPRDGVHVRLVTCSVHCLLSAICQCLQLLTHIYALRLLVPSNHTDIALYHPCSRRTTATAAVEAAVVVLGRALRADVSAQQTAVPPLLFRHSAPLALEVAVEEALRDWAVAQVGQGCFYTRSTASGLTELSACLEAAPA
jgi:hypothetical protein